jgi:predicted O-methyltransferase YrrM
MTAPSLVLFHDKTEDPTYRPSFRFGGDSLGERHRAAHTLVDDVPGWLRPEDALKLYELAYLAQGPILEIGTFHGKSAVLMASAVQDAGQNTTIYSLDVDHSYIRAAREQALSHEVADRVVFVRGTVGAFARMYPHLQPALVFVDGDHSYAGVQRDLTVLERLIPDNGLILFHDFNDDPRNDDPANREVKVRPAVWNSWVPRDCDFAGVFGCCGLFVRRRGRPAGSCEAPLVDLLLFDSLRIQYLQRLRRPLGRAWRSFRAH